MNATINRLEGITMQAEQNSQDTAVERFNAYWQWIRTPEAQALRDAERAEYEERYEAMQARKRAEVGSVIGTRRACDICHQIILDGERFHDDGAEIAHVACIGGWFRGNFGREGLS